MRQERLLRGGPPITTTTTILPRFFEKSLVGGAKFGPVLRRSLSSFSECTRREREREERREERSTGGGASAGSWKERLEEFVSATSPPHLLALFASAPSSSISFPLLVSLFFFSHFLHIKS